MVSDVLLLSYLFKIWLILTGEPGRGRGSKGIGELNLEGGADEVQPEADRGRKATPEMLEALAVDISSHWTGGYGDLGSIPGVIGTAVMGVSIMEMVAGTIVRMVKQGPGLWMIAAFWGTAFQIIIMPSRWALEWGQAQGKIVSQAIEARVGGANLPADGGGTASSN
jgi:hypothetical protein